MYVYILASKRNGTLYTGVTSDLVRRVWEHKQGIKSKFASKYGACLLVYFEQHETPLGAIAREKQMKKWYRAWKLALIEKDNWDWIDLYPRLLG